jgi:hypothetical protein
MLFIRVPMAFSGHDEAEILKKMREKLAALVEEIEVDGETEALLLRVTVTREMIADLEAADWPKC